MTNLDLRPDCARCDALCCVLLAFDASDAFAFSKPACAPCRNLADDNRCRVHSTLAEQGFSGCVAFDCQGAGRRITRKAASMAGNRAGSSRHERPLNTWPVMR
jgi:hypothetical protein